MKHRYGLYKRSFAKWDKMDDTFYWFDKKGNRVLYFEDGKWIRANDPPKEWFSAVGSGSMEPSNPLIFLVLTGCHFEAPK